MVAGFVPKSGISGPTDLGTYTSLEVLQKYYKRCNLLRWGRKKSLQAL